MLSKDEVFEDCGVWIEQGSSGRAQRVNSVNERRRDLLDAIEVISSTLHSVPLRSM